VLIDLTVAIQVGVVLAAFLFMKRMVDVANIRPLGGDEEDPAVSATEAAALRRIPAAVEVFEVNGPFFFGAAHKFASTLGRNEVRPRVLVLRLRNVLALDATGLQVLEALQKEAEHGGPALVLSGVQAQPLRVLVRGGFLARLGEGNVAADLSGALARARAIIMGAPEPGVAT
jgi:sulfate permease, SulP family